jgi:hypothetical protein
VRVHAAHDREHGCYVDKILFLWKVGVTKYETYFENLNVFMVSMTVSTLIMQFPAYSHETIGILIFVKSYEG